MTQAEGNRLIAEMAWDACMNARLTLNDEDWKSAKDEYLSKFSCPEPDQQQKRIEELENAVNDLQENNTYSPEHYITNNPNKIKMKIPSATTTVVTPSDTMRPIIREESRRQSLDRYPHWWQSIHRKIFSRGFIVGAWYNENKSKGMTAKTEELSEAPRSRNRKMRMGKTEQK